MHRSVTIVLTAALAASALVACSGGKQSNSSSTTTTSTTTQTSPAASAAASPAASAAASPAASSATTTKTTTTTTKSTTTKTTSGNMMAAAGASAAAGQKVYTTNCSSCHQANGKGQPGVFPPLDGNPTVTGDATKVITIVKNGLSGKISVNGTSYNGQMPSWKGTLSDSDIASVVTYIRSAWSNKASAVTAAQVTAVK